MQQIKKKILPKKLYSCKRDDNRVTVEFQFPGLLSDSLWILR